jgi:hypothetical protein
MTTIGFVTINWATVVWAAATAILCIASGRYAAWAERRRMQTNWTDWIAQKTRDEVMMLRRNEVQKDRQIEQLTHERDREVAKNSAARRCLEGGIDLVGGPDDPKEKPRR